jgi:lipoprotein-releasing system permease protein
MIYITLKEGYTKKELYTTLSQIREKTSKITSQRLSISSWVSEKNRLLAAVEVERTVTQIIIILILITTGFGFGSLLYILVINKTKEIGYLKSLGMRNEQVFLIFISISLVISLAGSFLGGIIGYLFAKNINEIASFLEKYTGFKLFPPQEYLFYKIPYYWSWKWAAFITLLNIGILLLACLLPAFRAVKLQPAQTLKNE